MERLSALDRALLACETPNQQLNVLAIMVLDPDPDVPPSEAYRIARDRIVERLPLVPTMRRRLRSLPWWGYPIWEDDPHLVVDAHIHQAILPAPGDIRELGKLAGEIASRPLQRDRPLWEMWLVTGLEEGRTATVCKVHHALLDGTSGLGSLAAFFDLEPNAEPMDFPLIPPSPTLSTLELINETLDASARWRRDLVKVGPRVFGMVRAVADQARRPDRDPALSLPFSGPKLTMSGPLTARRSVELTSLGLDRLKPLRRTFDVTLNDVIVALCAGTIRSYLEYLDELPTGPLVAAIPVSERGLEDKPEGNKFSSMFYNLPVHIKDPAERVEYISRSSALGKEFYEQVGRESLASLAALAPPSMIGPAMNAISALRRVVDVAPPLANVMISNVRGVDFPLWVGGGKVTRMLPMGPLLEGAALNITAASYLDSVSFGFQACPDLVPDLVQLADGIHDALIELEAAAAVS
jgi:diacylglycerol O-acyltransferase / wax synthase